MNNPKVTAMLGLAQKAGKLVSGEIGVMGALKSKKAKLILVAADSSDNTKKVYTTQAKNYHVPYKEVLTKEEMGECIGKNYRAAIAVTDEGFAGAVLDLLSENRRIYREDTPYRAT